MGLIGLLHAAQPDPSDADFTRLVYWSTTSTRLRACKRCLSARLWRNEQIGRFLGTRLRWCKRERMGKRADTENHFCVRHASNQTASQLDLYSCIRKPIKRLWYLTSLATAGLHAACEPGCAHPQTNQPQRDPAPFSSACLKAKPNHKCGSFPFSSFSRRDASALGRSLRFAASRYSSRLAAREQQARTSRDESDRVHTDSFF